MADDANPRVALGDNHPPVEDAFPAFHLHIGDLFDEAKNFLDGEGIKSEAEAEAVSRLMDMVRTAARDADGARVKEKKPHDDAAKLVQQKWKPLLDRADLAIDTCKKVLASWLLKQDAEQRAAAENARVAAARAAEAARQAMRKTDVTDLAAREAAEALTREAKQAEADASRAEKRRPQATGGVRATTLRTSYRPELVDPKAALVHYVETNPAAIKACMQALAEADIRAGKRAIPGFSVHEERSVV